MLFLLYLVVSVCSKILSVDKSFYFIYNEITLLFDNTMELTDKQKRFCQEYMVDNNATQAAIRAGYSKKTAKSIGQENLTFKVF